MIDGTGTVAIGAAVTLLTEVFKTTLPTEQGKAAGPYISLVLSLIVTLIYVFSMPAFPPTRTDLWPLFMGWLTIYGTATGVYHGAKLAKRRAV
jgi:predicted membrane protein